MCKITPLLGGLKAGLTATSNYPIEAVGTIDDIEQEEPDEAETDQKKKVPRSPTSNIPLICKGG